jgi:hypothetical protein
MITAIVCRVLGETEITNVFHGRHDCAALYGHGKPNDG